MKNEYEAAKQRRIKEYWGKGNNSMFEGPEAKCYGSMEEAQGPIKREHRTALLQALAGRSCSQGAEDEE